MGLDPGIFESSPASSLHIHVPDDEWEKRFHGFDALGGAMGVLRKATDPQVWRALCRPSPCETVSRTDQAARRHYGGNSNLGCARRLDHHHGHP